MEEEKTRLISEQDRKRILLVISTILQFLGIVAIAHRGHANLAMKALVISSWCSGAIIAWVKPNGTMPAVWMCITALGFTGFAAIVGGLYTTALICATWLLGFFLWRGLLRDTKGAFPMPNPTPGANDPHVHDPEY